jgi:translation initiation factor IF-3
VKKEKSTQSKRIQVNTNISMQDLKNKAQQAIELSKKTGKIRVFTYFNDNNLDKSKNILFTVKIW